MSIGLVCLAVGVSLTSGKASPQSGDTLEISRQVKRELIRYYDAMNERFIGTLDGREGRCSADEGHECWGGDPDRFSCPPDLMCHPYNELNDLIETMKAGSLDHPDAGWLVGYTVYTLMKAKRTLEAFEIAQACTDSDWYCPLIEGYVFQMVGRTDEAEWRFRRGLEVAPDSIVLLLSEASWVLPAPDRETA